MVNLAVNVVKEVPMSHFNENEVLIDIKTFRIGLYFNKFFSEVTSL